MLVVVLVGGAFGVVFHTFVVRTWLIAHALEPERIRLRADAAPRQPLQLEVVR